MFTGPQVPFGSYPITRYAPPNPIPHPPLNAPRFQRRIVKKTILIANLSARDPNKPASSKTNGLVHTVVTQVIVSLDSSVGECSVKAVAEMVKRQVGFHAILLDSKLYPLIDSEATSGADFWKSTRKIIAASRSMYEKLGGVSPSAELSQVEDDVVIVKPTCKKMKVQVGDDIIKGQLEDINKKLDRMDKKLSFIDDIRAAFQCVICRSPARLPVVAPCCQRIIGCGECVQRWILNNSRCPLCSVSGRMMESFGLKGIDHLTGFFRVGESVVDTASQSTSSVNVEDVDDDSANEFEDTPTFRVPRPE